MSDFFEPPPPRDLEPETSPEWAGAPEAVVPRTLPIGRIIARTEEVAIYLSCLSVYPVGFEFEVFALAKDRDSDLEPFDFEYGYEAERSGEIPSGQLRLGFQFADGERATNTGGRFEWDGEFIEPPAAPVMRSGRGRSDGQGRWQHWFWVWPLPPAGPLEFVCEWPAGEVPMTRYSLDAQALIDAARRCERLFAENQ
jgi:hypothetical protein